MRECDFWHTRQCTVQLLKCENSAGFGYKWRRTGACSFIPGLYTADLALQFVLLLHLQCRDHRLPLNTAIAAQLCNCICNVSILSNESSYLLQGVELLALAQNVHRAVQPGSLALAASNYPLPRQRPSAALLACGLGHG